MGIFFHHVMRRYNKRADALANRALDSGNESRWYHKGLRALYQTMLEGETECIFIQARFDGAYRRKTCRSAIGVAIELAFVAGGSRPLFDLALEINSQNSYEAELSAAARAITECRHLYTKLHISSF